MRTEHVLRLVPTLLLALALAGCGALDRRSTPAPVRDAGERPSAAEKPPVAPKAPEPKPPATGSLKTYPVSPRPAVPPPAEREPAALPEPAAPAVSIPPPTAPRKVEPASVPAAPAAPAALPAGTKNPAVLSLLREAEQAFDGGDLPRSAASVERALRIEPRNPFLWNRLSHIRLSQGRGGDAADLAAKSNSFATGQPSLQRDNWMITATVRRSAGDLAGAKAAEQKARSVQ